MKLLTSGWQSAFSSSHPYRSMLIGEAGYRWDRKRANYVILFADFALRSLQGARIFALAILGAEALRGARRHGTVSGGAHWHVVRVVS